MLPRPPYCLLLFLVSYTLCLPFYCSHLYSYSVSTSTSFSFFYFFNSTFLSLCWRFSRSCSCSLGGRVCLSLTLLVIVCLVCERVLCVCLQIVSIWPHLSPLSAQCRAQQVSNSDSSLSLLLSRSRSPVRSRSNTLSGPGQTPAHLSSASAQQLVTCIAIGMKLNCCLT